MQDRIDWSGLEALLAFSLAGSLSGAARDLGVAETTVARQIKRLGARLGANMLRRSGTRLILSHEGEAAAKAAREMDLVSRLLLKPADGAGGLASVRVTGLAPFLAGIVAPAVQQLLIAQPGIRLDLVADDRNLSIAEREADIAVRFARPEGPHLIGRRLATFGYAIFSERKLRASAMHLEPSWLQLSAPLQHLPEAQWVERSVESANIVMYANALDVLAESAASGAGRALLPVFLARRYEKLQQLGPIVLNREVWLVYHQDDRRTPRIRAVANWLIETFKACKI